MPPATSAVTLSTIDTVAQSMVPERSFVTMSVLEKIISNLFGIGERQSRLMRYDKRIEEIIKATSDVTGVRVVDLLSKRRTFARERHIAMYLSVRLLGCSYPEIGRAFGRDHTTVRYAFDKVSNRGRGRTKTNRYLKEIEQCLSA